MHASPPSATHRAALRTCVEAAAAGGRFLMEKMVDATRHALQEREGRLRNFHERAGIAESLNLLKRYEADLVNGFAGALVQAFDAEASLTKPKAASIFNVRFDQLELMDDEQVQTSVEMARAQQMALHTADLAFTQLNPLVCAALGLPHVMAERNPIRPEAYILAMQTVISRTGVTSAVRMTWMQHMCDVLGPELVQVYDAATGVLRKAGVTGVAFAAAPAYALPQGVGWDALEGAKTVVPVHAPALAPTTAMSTAAPHLNASSLRRLISGDLDKPGTSTPTVPRAPVGSFSMSAKLPDSLDFPELLAPEEDDLLSAEHRPPEFEATLPAALDALEDHNQIEIAVRRAIDRRSSDSAARDGAADRGSSVAAKGRPLMGAYGAGQSVGLEVVSVMIESMVQDSRLLPPVQQAVRDLEPSLMQLVLADPRFFSDRDHPARQLLDEMTQRSIAYSSTTSAGFPGFLRSLRQAVDVLSTSFIVDAQPFQSALSTLRATWAELSNTERIHREKAVQALLRAEQRNLLADKIAAEVAAWPEASRVPSVVMAFVRGPWAHVVAHARLEDRSGNTDPGGFYELIPNLLWSAQPAVTRNHLARLTRLVPPLLGKLREGLRTIGYPLEQSGPFLEQLVALHQMAFRPEFPRGANDSRFADSRSPQEAENSKTSRTPAESHAWLAPNEVKQSGFMAGSADTATANNHSSGVSAPFPRSIGTMETVRSPSLRGQGAGNSPGQEVPAMEGQLAMGAEPPGVVLAIGSWVELENNGRPVRTQLTWASPHETLFLFTAADGSTQSMTRRMRDKLAADGLLRILSGQTVVDGALDAVAHAAMRNSVGPG